MPQMAVEVFNIFSLYHRLGELSDNFDVNASLNVGKLNIKLKNGDFVRCGGFTDFATQYNTHCADVIDTTKSYQSGLRFYLTLKDACAEPTPVVVEQTPTPIAEVIVESEVVIPDWAWAEALPSTRAAKQELDEYATKFGVSLDKGKKIADMVAEFKEQFNK